MIRFFTRVRDWHPPYRAIVHDTHWKEETNMADDDKQPKVVEESIKLEKFDATEVGKRVQEMARRLTHPGDIAHLSVQSACAPMEMMEDAFTTLRGKIERGEVLLAAIATIEVASIGGRRAIDADVALVAPLLPSRLLLQLVLADAATSLGNCVASAVTKAFEEQVKVHQESDEDHRDEPPPATDPSAKSSS